MNHNVGTVFQRLNQDRCKSVVNDKHNVVTVSNFGNAFDVEHVRVGVAESFAVNHLCIRFDGCLYCFQIREVNNSVLNTLSRKCVRDKVVSATVKIVGCNDMVAVLENILQSVSDCCCARCYCQACCAAFEGCNALFKNALSGVGQTSVNVACISKTKTVGCVF